MPSRSRSNKNNNNINNNINNNNQTPPTIITAQNKQNNNFIPILEKTNPYGRKPFLLRTRKDPKTNETKVTLVKVTTAPSLPITNGDTVTEKHNRNHRDTLPLLHVNGNGYILSDEHDKNESISPCDVKRYGTLRYSF